MRILQVFLFHFEAIPMEAIEKEREIHFKKQARHTILLFGNRNSFAQSRKKR